MGIYLIKSGTVECDTCKKVLAKIRCSDKVLENLESHPLNITCLECDPILPEESLPPIQD